MDMEGLPLDVILLVSLALAGVVSLVAYISRKLGSSQVCIENREQRLLQRIEHGGGQLLPVYSGLSKHTPCWCEVAM